MKPSYILTSESLTAIIEAETHTLTSDNPSFEKVVQLIRSRARTEEILLAFRNAKAVARYSEGQLEVLDGAILYKGEEIHNVVVDRILGFMDEGLPVDPLIKFLERLLQNPSRKAVDSLYTFLEQGNMPITEDGTFLGYKGVSSDYLDIYTHTIDNHVGVTPPRFERNQVDDDFTIECSKGYHVGTLEYATKYALCGRVMIVEVAPEDVVSVPTSDASWKIRCVGYKVVAEAQGPMKDTFATPNDPYFTDFKGKWFNDDDSADYSY